MDLEHVVRVAALIAVLGTSVVFGTDVFCAIVLRPALAHVGDAALVTLTGYVHRYGDRRMPIAAVPGVAGAAVGAIAAVVAGHVMQAIAACTALAALLIWLLIYLRVSAPINRHLTAAAEAGHTLATGRRLQTKWDSVIDVRAALQGIAVGASCLVLIA